MAIFGLYKLMKKILYLLLFLCANANAQTKPFVPRADGEGSLGLSTVTWGAIYADSLVGTLTGSASLNVLKSGDTMTGPLTLSGSSLTVTGSAFSVGGSTFVVTGGNVGIGTGTPGARLAVSSTGGFTNLNVKAYSATASERPRIWLQRSRSTTESFGATTVGDDLGIIEFQGVGASASAFVNAASIKAIQTGATDVYAPSDMLFHTTPPGSSGLTERLRINSTGYIGVGTTAPASKLHISSGALTIDGTGAGIFVGNGGMIKSRNSDNTAEGWFYTNNTYETAIRSIGANRVKAIGNDASYLFGAYDGVFSVFSTTFTARINGFVGVNNTNPASTLQIGTSLNGTTNYLQIDTLAADTAGPPDTGDCDAATEVGRMVASTRYTATAEYRIWFCTQTGASAYGWKYLELQTP